MVQCGPVFDGSITKRLEMMKERFMERGSLGKLEVDM